MHRAKPVHLDKSARIIVDKAREVVANPEDMNVRREYLRVMADLDRAAAVIVHLAQGPRRPT